ncbi:hypothetical protein HMPREF9348_04988 [Escherichia coli MS 145-7]|nr:hypothetical protein HMPREF9348_04988 [Escherichia coli MS 145-7]
MRCRNIAPETFARTGEPTSPNESDNPPHPCQANFWLSDDV